MAYVSLYESKCFDSNHMLINFYIKILGVIAYTSVPVTNFNYYLAVLIKELYSF